MHLRALCTGISVGTERLVGLGHVPAELTTAMACQGMQGTFDLPVLYGYSFVGEVVAGPDRGRRAFVMRPHQRQAVVPRSELHWLPDALPTPRATLFANLETARNAVWDAELNGDETVVIVGGGAVGLLVAFVLAREHSARITVVERDVARRKQATEMPWIAEAVAPDDVDLDSYAAAFHTSGTAAGLQLAIDAVGFEGHVHELSWYGDRSINLQLGHGFHYKRKRICASQVGTVAKSHRADGFAGRAKVVMELLGDSQLDAMLVESLAFADLPNAFSSIYTGQSAAPSPVVLYEQCDAVQ